jgi:hypothetical protein
MCKYENKWLFCKSKNTGKFEIPLILINKDDSFEKCIENRLNSFFANKRQYELNFVTNYYTVFKGKEIIGEIYYIEITEPQIFSKFYKSKLLFSEIIPNRLKNRKIYSIIFEKVNEWLRNKVNY